MGIEPLLTLAGAPDFDTYLVNGNMVPIGLAGINIAVAAAVEANKAEQEQQEQSPPEETEPEQPKKSPQRRKKTKKEEQPDESAAYTGQPV